jgi:hypothetical protein
MYNVYAAVLTGSREQKPRQFSLIHLPFAHLTNGSYPFAKGLNGLAHLWLRLTKAVAPEQDKCHFGKGSWTKILTPTITPALPRHLGHFNLYVTGRRLSSTYFTHRNRIWK